ncbi:torsin-1A-interacting protein 2-like isoform X2 [Plectropomus leopardus]|uniref:torsin-1A-interacting protein 2-like isoform X2 n=1 Tax=Plectropomus leopardus TaxID=160734 RepID=UPI001C4C0431|nr:torsin-1A-interacting protein 2-like isoform X2 [Plectropomus leopardus]
MAEQDTDHQHTSGEKGEPQPTIMDHVSPFDERKLKETDVTLHVKPQLSDDSATRPASSEMNEDNEEFTPPDEDTMLNVKEKSTPFQADEESHSDHSTEKQRNEQPTMTAEISNEDITLSVKENSTPLQADEESHGDHSTEKPRNEQPTVTAEEITRQYHTGEEKEPETTTPPTLGDRRDQVDGPDTETPDTDNINAEAEENDRSHMEEDLTPQEEEEKTFTPQAETIGPTTQETAEAEPEVSVVTRNIGGNRIYLIAGILGLVLAILVSHLLQPESPPQKDDVRQIDIFLRQLEKVKTQFPNQRAELWNRSKIHLLRHLQTAQPTEPVSLILTAGHRAERTLHCLAQSLASAFSSALNASVVHIDGASKASQDSDQVKLDIDSKLQGAFEGDKPVAVINRFEELPPGSTLIFYRYCDHENAAYKKTCLIFTVLLGEEEEIPAETRLSTVEEMVDDHLQKKFLSDGYPVSFDRMDLDKYGGLWSRISHLILPVAAEERIELEGC